jgi:hypothetical protein
MRAVAERMPAMFEETEIQINYYCWNPPVRLVIGIQDPTADHLGVYGVAIKSLPE